MIVYHPLVYCLTGLARHCKCPLYQPSSLSTRVHGARVVAVAAIVVVVIVSAFIVSAIALAWPTAPFLLTAVVSLDTSLSISISSFPLVHVQHQVPHSNWLTMGGHTKHAGMAKASSRHSSHGIKKHATVLPAHKQADRQQAQQQHQEDIIHSKNVIHIPEHLSDGKQVCPMMNGKTSKTWMLI
jgi:hypothetical protein